MVKTQTFGNLIAAAVAGNRIQLTCYR